MKTDVAVSILYFYNGTGTDHQGRTLSQIVQKSDRWLEETHDYIQWLFPLYVRSQFNPDTPLLTDEVRAAFTDPENPNQAVIQQNFGSAIYRMLVFYGYSFSPGSTDVSPTGEWRDKADNWLTEGNHNFMRMSRMLRSMMLLGWQQLARSFYECLLAAARANSTAISKRTLAFWEEAVSTVPAD